MTDLEKRLYFLVPYNISEIQKGIQAGHAALEYAELFGTTPEYKDFINNWKTWIILDGGTTNKNVDEDTGLLLGSLDNIVVDLNKYNEIHDNDIIKYSTFHEPDLNNALTAICLLVDETVFNRKDYPDYSDWLLIDNNFESSLYEYKKQTNYPTKTYFLKELLNNKKLA